MQTYTHYLITAVLDRKVKQHQARQGTDQAGGTGGWIQALPQLRTPWFLFGSVAPDLPLIAITLFYLAVDLHQGCAMGPDPATQNASRCIQPDGTAGSNLGYLFNYMFFNEPWVKAAHNLFHAPFMVLAYVGIGYWASRAGRRWGSALFWFGLACLIHTAIDIPLHYDDGPLLLFPFEWSLRFYSPVSYWDPARYGRIFAVFEHVLALGLLAYLIVDWRRRRKAKAVHPASS